VAASQTRRRGLLGLEDGKNVNKFARARLGGGGCCYNANDCEYGSVPGSTQMGNVGYENLWGMSMEANRECSGHWRTATSTGALLLAICFLIGCGSSSPEKTVGTVKVIVTFGDEPITNGAIEMVVVGEGKGAFGNLDSTGTVRLTDVEVGNYTVSVVPPTAPDPDPSKPLVPVKEYANIPSKFRTEATSPLKATVVEGSNEFKFDLKE